MIRIKRVIPVVKEESRLSFAALNEAIRGQLSTQPNISPNISEKESNEYQFLDNSGLSEALSVVSVFERIV